MSYLMSALFLVLISIIYYFSGTLLLKFFNINRNTFAAKYLLGFCSVFLLGFLIGFPCQLFSVSWTIFFTIFTFALIICISLLIYRNKFILIKDKIHFNVIFSHLKKYWFIYIFVILFSSLSITNMTSYLTNNYRDDYYISKMVQLVGTPHLLNENYSYGSVLQSRGLFGYAKLQGYRIFNTYELTYAYFATLFCIKIPFFCRVTMVIHNYLIVFFSLQLFGSLYLDEKISQYSIVFYVLYMIPSGYASRGNLPLNIRVFENWRFQVGIFYGGSITRICSLPILIYYTLNMKSKRFILKIFNLLTFSVVLLAFQTNAIIYLVIVLLIISLFYLLTQTYKHFNKKLLNIITITILMTILIASTNILYKLPINLESVIKNTSQYELYYLNIFKFDFIAKYAFVVLGMLLYTIRENKEESILTLIICILFLIFKFNKSSNFLNFIFPNYIGIVRLLSSLILLCTLYYGILLITCLDIFIAKISKKCIIISALSLAMVISMLLFIKSKYNEIKNYTNREDAFTEGGYSLKAITSNDSMIPDMFVDVGNYFNKLPYGNYKLVSEGSIIYRNLIYDDQSFLLSSNRIELAFESYWNPTIEYSYVNRYLQRKDGITFNYILPIVKKYNIHYFFTTRKLIAKDLGENGLKLVLGNRSKGYWLYKY